MTLVLAPKKLLQELEITVFIYSKVVGATPIAITVTVGLLLF